MPRTGHQKEQQPFQAALRDRFSDHNTTLGLPAHAAVAGRSSTSAEPTLRINDEAIASRQIRVQPGFVSLSGEGNNVGRDRGQPVSSDYQSPFALTGATIDHVLLKPGDDNCVDLERESEAAFRRE